MTPEAEWPFLSIILAVRNGERFLAEAIRSVEAQDYPRYELIVVDGHSTDRTAAIAQGFSGLKFLVQPGRGLAEAWNVGIAQAQSNWLVFLEHDDLWTPDKLRTQISYMRRHPELQFTLSHAQFFLEPGCAWPAGYNPAWLKKPQIGSMLSSLIARRSVFDDDQVGKFDESMMHAADMDWFSRAKDRRIPMAYLEETLMLKRVHDSNVTTQVQLNHAELLQVIKRTVDRKRTAAAS
jgi:glycosyltransferase involved in cell wall biosynthesis